MDAIAQPSISVLYIVLRAQKLPASRALLLLIILDRQVPTRAQSRFKKGSHPIIALCPILDAICSSMTFKPPALGSASAKPRSKVLILGLS